MFTYAASFFSVVVLASGFPSSSGKQVQVTIKDGTIKGLEDATGVQSFLGIPFAQPPVENLRFFKTEESTEHRMREPKRDQMRSMLT